MKNDPVFRLRKHTSSRISNYLRSISSGKNGQSILKYDPKTWDDNNFATWTWNIDHIIPHSDLHYSSMEDDNFKKCWALSNLRPINAKQNVLDGVSGIRHKVKRNKAKC